MGQIIQGRRRLKKQEFTTSGTFTVPAGVTGIQYLLASAGTNTISGAQERGSMPVTPGQILTVVIGTSAGYSQLGYIRVETATRHPNTGEYIERYINDTWCTFAGPGASGYCEIFWEE